MIQPYCAAVCICSGIFAGIFLEPVAALNYIFKNAALRFISDILCGILTAISLIFMTTVFHLPDFRFYMPICALAGLILYYRSFHRILAFWSKKLYNAYRSSCRRGLMRLYRAICRKRSSKKSSLAQRLPQ